MTTILDLSILGVTFILNLFCTLFMLCVISYVECVDPKKSRCRELQLIGIQLKERKESHSFPALKSFQLEGTLFCVDVVTERTRLKMGYFLF